MATLPCDNGGGSLNNPATPPTTPTTPYVPPVVCVGELELSSTRPDTCQTNDQNRQESYIAEALNISGAPINIYKLLGVHEQGNGSLLTQGTLVSSAPYPGYPLSNLNTGLVWRSFESGSATTNTSYLGLDFGIKRLANGSTEFAPPRSKWTLVGAISITQSNLPNNFARQVKVEVAEEDITDSSQVYSGFGNGLLQLGPIERSATKGRVECVAISPSTFSVTFFANGSSPQSLGTATVGTVFRSQIIGFSITLGSTAFVPGDAFTIFLEYTWKRVGIFNLIQSPTPQILNLHSQIRARAIRVTPTLFQGTGEWEVFNFDILPEAKTDVNNIQDLFFNENRDRDYAIVPIQMKVQYNPADSASDLSRFGLGLLDQYSFTTSFATMVSLLGRPVVTGDIIEVIPEMQYDHNLKPIRKFLEVTDTGWSSEGFSTHWRPTVYRFSAQQALPSQETRDIFGTMDTQKYLIPDSILADNVGEQLDITPLTMTEEILKAANDAVPEIGDSAAQKTTVPVRHPNPPVNKLGQPPALKPNPKKESGQSVFVEDGLPKDGAPYGEGYKLPIETSSADGDYFRLYYPPETRIAPRLYRFSSVKNRWIFLEQDRRGDYSSHKPSGRAILQSTQQFNISEL